MANSLLTAGDGVALSNVLSRDIWRLYDTNQIVKAGMGQRYDDRAYKYISMCKDACMRLFRLSDGDGLMYHDGMIWKPLSNGVLREALRKSLVNDPDATDCADESLKTMGMRMGDWLKIEGKLLKSCVEAIGLSPLGEVGQQYVAFRNGIWDFSDVAHPKQRKWEERLPVTVVLPYDYSVDAVCPMWRMFLSQVLNARQTKVLQRYLSLGLVDRYRRGAPKIEQSLWLIGQGANGKSVIFDTVRGVYGMENISEVSLDGLIKGNLEERGRFIAMTEGKVFNYCSEIGAHDMTKNADAFKKLVSGEPQTVRQIGEKAREMTRIPFMIFNMNRKPKNKDLQPAVLRRLLFVTFDRVVRKEDMDTDLSNKLRSEFAGIRNWLIEGFIALQSDGYVFAETTESLEAQEQYMAEEQQTVQLYLRKHGIRSGKSVGVSDEPCAWSTSQDMWVDYSQWCALEGYDAESQKQFGQVLVHEGYKKKRWTGGNFWYRWYTDAENFNVAVERFGARVEKNTTP